MSGIININIIIIIISRSGVIGVIFTIRIIVVVVIIVCSLVKTIINKIDDNFHEIFDTIRINIDDVP